MLYFLLIHAPESYDETLSETEMTSLMGRYFKASEEMESAGVWMGGHRLRPVATATTLRIRDGETIVTDGPFAETKEQFGGYYLIDVESLDNAIAWAKKIPACEYGSVEVRPVWEMNS
jgi:hypothetical protein